MRKMKQNEANDDQDTFPRWVVFFCEIFSIPHFSKQRVCTCVCVYVCVSSAMSANEKDREQNLMNRLIWKPPVVRWFMGLITESIHQPEVPVFFCLLWDDRNTTAKQPHRLYPILIQKPIKQSLHTSLLFSSACVCVCARPCVCVHLLQGKSGSVSIKSKWFFQRAHWNLVATNDLCVLWYLKTSSYKRSI